MKNIIPILEVQDLIKNTNTFSELKNVLSLLPEKGINGPRYFYTSDSLIELIQEYEKGKHINVVDFPKELGLREKIKELLSNKNGNNVILIGEQDKNKKDISFIVKGHYAEISELLEKIHEGDDNTNIIAGIINKYGKEGINTLFEDSALIFELNEHQSMDEAVFFMAFKEYIPSLELRQYFCESIIKNQSEKMSYDEIAVYLMCCDQSELYTGKEELLVDYLTERYIELEGQKTIIPNIFKHLDLNSFILSIYKKYEKNKGELKDMYETVFLGSSIDLDKLNTESIRIFKESGIL